MKTIKSTMQELTITEMISILNEHLVNSDIYDPSKFDQQWTLLLRQLRDKLVNEQWVSIKEKLPERFKGVIIYDCNGLMKVDYMPLNPYTTHWRLLPEPPEL
jgi:hypothetical protein